MKVLSLNKKNVDKFVKFKEYDDKINKVLDSYDVLTNKSGLGNDFLGWLDLPLEYDKQEFEKIKKYSKIVRSNSQVLISVGIGGSYLGAKCAVEMFKKYFNNNDLEVVFVGNQLSGTYLNELLEYIKDKDYSINVISKSGTTTEPAIAFRILKQAIEKKYGKEIAKERIFVTTDKEKGALKTLSNNEGYTTFVVPDNVGGRYSVLTAVGLFPIACAGIDIDQVMKGAYDSMRNYCVKSSNNDAVKYAAIRNVLYEKNYDTELLVNYESRLNYFSEWWKQLFGETEGKDGLGIFPASVSFSTDLHSLGQMIQQGKRRFFETILNIEDDELDVSIPFDKDNLDGLNYLKDKSVNYVNKTAMKATSIAHTDGGVPNIVISIDKICPYTFGYLIYFFEFACALSAYTLGVNPFNQPGVEAYKKNMFGLLNKPGYEDIREKLIKLEDND